MAADRKSGSGSGSGRNRVPRGPGRGGPKRPGTIRRLVKSGGLGHDRRQDPLEEAGSPGLPGVRLHVAIQRAGLASRREAERLIQSGEVTVNGRMVTELGTRADPDKDHIKVRGRLIQQVRNYQYLAFHKPTACVTTMHDPQGRFCIGDLVRAMNRPVFPVGRLDYHSSGLLLLTNDGELANRLTHPRYHVPKMYLVKPSRPVTMNVVHRLREGVMLEDGWTDPAYVRRIDSGWARGWLEIRIREGRNQQIRRMLESAGLFADKLKRIEIGPLRLGDLPVREVRKLSIDQVRALRLAVGLETP